MENNLNELISVFFAAIGIAFVVAVPYIIAKIVMYFFKLFLEHALHKDNFKEIIKNILKD